MTKRTLYLAFVLTVSGCSKTMVVKEPSPVVVTAKPVPEPQPAPRVVVKKDRIQISEAIYFESDHAQIRTESLDLLNEIARVVNVHTELVKIRIEGHTDSAGDPKANLALSKKRAMMVRTYLIEQGVDARRLIAEGFGAENPIASNDDEDGRAKNRRVAFTVLDRVERDDEAAVTPRKHKGGAS